MTMQTVIIPTLDDGHGEIAETFQIKLLNPSVDLLGDLESVATIVDNEPFLDGDADQNGEVGFSDFLRIAANFGKTGVAWEDGDFNHDGRVAFDDFLLLSENFGRKRTDAKPTALSAHPVSASAVDQFLSDS